jgi:hypothetical protein
MRLQIIASDIPIREFARLEQGKLNLPQAGNSPREAVDQLFHGPMGCTVVASGCFLSMALPVYLLQESQAVPLAEV